MVKKARKSAIPKAPVVDQSEAPAKTKAVAVPKKGKKADVGKGKMISLHQESDSDDDFDAAPAMKFDKDNEDVSLDEEDAEMDDNFLEEMEEGEEFEEMEGSDMGEEVEEEDEDDDDFGVLDGQDSDESMDDESSGSDFETKVAKAKAALSKQQEEHARDAMLEKLTKKANVFSKKKRGDDEGEEGEEVEEAEEGDDEAEGEGEQVSFQERKDRIGEVLRVLESMSECREGDHSRQEYLDILRDDLVEVYEYNKWLMDKLMELFPPRELFEFLEVNEKQRPMTIRVNTLKTSRRDLAQALTRKGMSVEPTGPWCKVGLQIFESDVAVGSTTEYLAGHYLIQSASSFLPVMSMDIGDNMRVLDMTAAPGGKTTHIAQMMKNSGCLMANDVSAERLIALRGNILRMGITNTIVTNYNGVGYERIMNNFDRVLLDAPCTGIGVISRDPAIKTNKSEKDVQLRAMLQKKLILSAIDACKVGGIVVYSTCSILIEENEATVDYALKKRNIRIVETGVPFGRPGFTKHRKNRFHPSVALSRRYYPHAYNMDGFYVCKIEKLSNGENKDSKHFKEKVEKKPEGGLKRKAAEPSFPAPPAKVQRRLAGDVATEKKAEKKEKTAVKLTIKTTDSKGKKGSAKKEKKEKQEKQGGEKTDGEEAKGDKKSRWQKKRENAQKKKKAEKKKAKNEEYRAKKFGDGAAEAAKAKAKAPTKKTSAKKASAGKKAKK